MNAGCEQAAKLPVYTAVLAIAIATAGVLGLPACTSLGGGSATPPDHVDLSGTWKLDPKRSTDSRQALADLTKTARRETDRARQRANGPRFGGFESSDAALLAEPRMVFGPDLSLQRNLLAKGDWLKIEQRPDELVISNGETSRSYVPGERSVVSVPGGVADQRSGWKKREYWISLKPQVGPSATETFKLSPGGKELIETIDIGRDGRVPRVKVTRVYVPTQEPPSAFPSDD